MRTVWEHGRREKGVESRECVSSEVQHSNKKAHASIEEEDFLKLTLCSSCLIS